jgi:AcrR family transcriptional regulator
MTERNAATRRRLFDAAVELIGTRGYDDTSVDDIVEQAGMAKGTVYYHFAGKAELVDAVIRDRSNDLLSEFARIEQQHPHDPSEAITLLVGALLRFLMREPAYSRLLLSEMWRDDRPWYSTLKDTRRDAVNSICRVVHSGVESGEFRTDIDPEFAGYALFGMTTFCAIDGLAHDSHRPFEDLEKQILGIAWAALREC